MEFALKTRREFRLQSWPHALAPTMAFAIRVGACKDRLADLVCRPTSSRPLRLSSFGRWSAPHPRRMAAVMIRRKARRYSLRADFHCAGSTHFAPLLYLVGRSQGGVQASVDVSLHGSKPPKSRLVSGRMLERSVDTLSVMASGSKSGQSAGVQPQDSSLALLGSELLPVDGQTCAGAPMRNRGRLGRGDPCAVELPERADSGGVFDRSAETARTRRSTQHRGQRATRRWSMMNNFLPSNRCPRRLWILPPTPRQVSRQNPRITACDRPILPPR